MALRRGDGIYLRVTRTLLDALLVVLGAVTAFWWFVPWTGRRLALLRTAGAWLLCLLTLTSCGRYYYGKPSAPTWNWSADHTACLREVGILTENKQFALVSPKPYQGCMLARGWQREKKIEPEWGWFRGVEDDGVVEIMGSASAPPGSPSRDLWCRQTYVERSDWEGRLEQYHACLRQ